MMSFWTSVKEKSYNCYAYHLLDLQGMKIMK